MDIVKYVLEKGESVKNVEGLKVNKLYDLNVFFQDFVIADTNEINLAQLKSENGEEYLQNVCRDNMQVFVNKLVHLPSTKDDAEIFIKLPNSAFLLPREKPIPTPKPLTKWQKFAKEKGIRKQKKTNVTWDEILQRWVPTYGYKKVAAEKEKDWILEVPQNKDPNTDMFAEKQKLKKERIAKNEYQRLRNIAASKNVKVPKFGLPPLEGRMHIPQIQMAADIAKVSTASVGKFQPKLPHENPKSRLKKGKQKKAVTDSVTEKMTNITIAENVLKKKPKIDMNKAVAKTVRDNHTEYMHEQKKKKQQGKKKRKWQEDDSSINVKKPKVSGNWQAAGTVKKQKVSFKKPSSGKGKHVGKKEQRGRKRR